MELDQSRQVPEKSSSSEKNKIPVSDESSPFNASKQPLNLYYVSVSFLIILGPFLMGLMISALGPVEALVKRYAELKNISKGTLEYTTLTDQIKNSYTMGGLFPLGGLVGALLGGMIVDKYGRKYSTIFVTQLMIIGNVLKVMAYSLNFWMIYIARLFDGVASGSLMVCCVNWLLEMEPIRLHSTMKPLIQILINAGILLYNCVASDIAFADRWDSTYWVPIIASIVLTVASLLLPESYQFIYQKSRDENAARRYLKKIRGDGYVEQELLNMVNQVKSTSSVKQMSMIDFLKTKRYLPGIISGIYINLAQQITGINAIAAFTGQIINNLLPDSEKEKISTSKNSDLTGSQLAQKYLGLIIIASGFLSSVIFARFVSSYRRKMMLIIGFSGMTISLSLTMLLNTWGVNPIATGICLASFFLIFQIGPGPLVWFITSEIFPPETHAAALSLVTVANWLGNSCVYFLFPVMLGIIKIKTLYIFIALNVFTLFFLSFLMEETLGRTPNEVLDKYLKRWHMN